MVVDMLCCGLDMSVGGHSIRVFRLRVLPALLQLMNCEVRRFSNQGDDAATSASADLADDSTQSFLAVSNLIQIEPQCYSRKVMR
jgi:hypothetical protein